VAESLLRWGVEADEAVLRVQDNGFGIAPELLHRYSTCLSGRTHTRARPGRLGIGLTLVKRLVNLHGGTISVSAADQLRQCLTVRLPAVAASRVRSL